VVHVMRYGAATRDWTAPNFTGSPLWRESPTTRSLRRGSWRFHVVTHVLPGPEDGLAGRPAVAVPRSPGAYLAGDWVGASGWLSDAAMASGQHAGRLAAGAPAEDRTYPRVA
jgi:hypothetical protein